MASSLATLPMLDESVSIPATVRDLNSFRDWVHSEEFPDHVRASYIRGEIILEMSPQEIESHAKLKMTFYGELWDIVKKDDSGNLFPDPTHFVNEEADVSNEPDLIFVSWDRLRSGQVEYCERKEGSRRLIEVVGSPDMVAEIVSDSSVNNDTKKLPKSYFDAGVQEYWLVDARGEEIDFRIMTRGKSRFKRVSPDADGFVRSPIYQREFRLHRDLDPVGLYRYLLDVRSAD